MLLKYATNVCLLVINLFIYTFASATTFEIPENSNIIGATNIVIVAPKETLFDIAHKFDIGMFEMIEANPGIKPDKLKPGTQIIIPAEHILPSAPREGIVLNLAELRIYFYHPNSNLVSTYPVGIGRVGWKTPIGTTKITKKREHPTWHPPESIREAYEEKGITLPDFVPPGPKNPLGNYAMNLDWGGYLIHGTNQPTSVGLRSSSGCIRMYAEDIQALFNQVDTGTIVHFIHEPFKIGKKDNNIYLEAHKPLPEPYYDTHEDSEKTLKEEIKSISKAKTVNIDWPYATKEMKETYGYPIVIGVSQ